MSKAFSEFKTRYIAVDFIFAFAVTLPFVVAAMLLLPELFIDSLTQNASNPYSLYMNIYYIAFSLISFLAILKRAKRSNVVSDFLIGSAAIKSIKWIPLLSLFYGILTLEYGISALSTFVSYHVSPEMTQRAVEASELGLIPDSSGSLFGQILSFLVAAVSLVIVAPITEEYIFRGILLHRFTHKWGKTVGIIVSSVMFGAVHFNIHAISIGVGGLLYALVYLRTRNLLFPILLHSIHNAYVLVMNVANQWIQADTQGLAVWASLWNGAVYVFLGLPIVLFFCKWPRRESMMPYDFNAVNRSRAMQ